MKEYFKFLWECTIHPKSFMDLLAPFQLVLFMLFIYYVIMAFISIYKHNKKLK